MLQRTYIGVEPARVRRSLIETSTAHSGRSDSTGFSCYPATAADAEFLWGLYFELRAPEFAPLELPAPALEQLLRMQHRAQGQSYSERFPDAVNRIVWLRGARVGRLLVSYGADEVYLVDIIIAAAYRDRGIGSELLRTLSAETEAMGVPLRLMVATQNPAARKLYDRLGFTAVADDGQNITMERSPRGAEIILPVPGNQG